MANNRPKYLKYGDVFMPSKQQVYKEEEIQKYRQNYGFQSHAWQNNANRNISNNVNNNIDQSTQFDNDTSNQHFVNVSRKFNNNVPNSQQQFYNNDFDNGNDNINRGIDLQEDYQFNDRSQPVLNRNFIQRNTMGSRNINPFEDRSHLNFPNNHRQQFPLQQMQQYGPNMDNTPRQYFQSTIWQKFIITFTSLLSIVCLVWIAYNWSKNKHYQPPVIEPEKTSFKVLPDENENNINPYQDKTVYSRVDNKVPTSQIGHIQQQPAPPFAPPNEKLPIVEYSIIEDKDYYVKCAIDPNVDIAKGQLTALRKKLTTFPDSDMIENVTCSIKTVANTAGQKGTFILIGPFKEDNVAQEIGHFCKIKGEIISVRKNKKS